VTTNGTADVTGMDETDVETEKVTDESVDAATHNDDATTETETQPEPPGGVVRQSVRWARARLGVILLVTALIASAGVATWLYFERYQPKQQTDPSVARAVVNAASDGTVALLSYSPESLDKDFATAKSHLSGDFLSYYNQFTEQIVAPAAKQKSLKTTAHVMRAGLSEIHADTAVVLVFVDQSTTSKDHPDPSMASSGVLVTLTRVDGQWLITKFNPV